MQPTSKMQPKVLDSGVSCLQKPCKISVIFAQYIAHTGLHLALDSFQPKDHSSHLGWTWNFSTPTAKSDKTDVIDVNIDWRNTAEIHIRQFLKFHGL